MRLPHDLVLTPRVAQLWGHDGWTLFFWTFVSTMPVGAHFARHEKRHVTHWLIGTTLGALVIALLCWFTALSWWWLLASPLGFLLPYFACFLVPGGYHANWFERDAERYAAKEALR